MKAQKKQVNLDHVSYSELKDGVLQTWNGTYVAGLVLSPLDIECGDETALNEIGARLVRFLNELSDRFTYRIHAHNQIIQGKAQRDFTIWIQLNPESLRPLGNLPLFNTQDVLTKIEDQSSEGKSTLKQEIARIATILKGLGFSAQSMTDKETLGKLKYLFRPNSVSEIHHLISLKQADLIIKDNLFFYDHTYWGGISVAEYPDVVATGQMVHALLSQAECITNLTIKPCDSQKVAEQLKQKRKISASLTITNSRLRDLESEAKLQSEDELLESLIVGQEKVFECQISSVVSGLDYHYVEHNLAKLSDQFRSQGYQIYREAISLYPVFRSILPGESIEKTRQQLLPSSCAQALFPIFDTDRGHPVPKLTFHDRFGSKVGIDPWDSSLPSYNAVVSGTSGSGKSFLSNILLKNLFEGGETSVFVIDIGGSYRRLTQLKGGQYVSFDLNGEAGFNPLGGTSTKDPSSLEAATDIISGIVADERRPISKIERSKILQELCSLSEKLGEKLQLGTVRAEWLKSSDPFLKDAAQILFAWTGERPYGRLLDNNNPLNTKSSWTCFDLRGLSDHRELQRVVMLSVVKRVWDIVRYSDSKKILLLDEVWALIRNESAFIGEAFRTFRKHNAAAVAVTQSIEDLATEALTSAVLNNSPTKIVLKQSLRPERLQKLLELNPRELEIVSGLRSIKGEFSEFFMINGDKRRFLRLEPTAEDYWFATTNPGDLEFIQKFLKTHPELTELQACREIAKRYGKERP